MAIEHAVPGEVIDLETFGPQNTDTHTVALVKTDRFEAVRLFTRAGNTVLPHKVDGPLTWLHIEGGTVHSIEAKTDCVLLVTIVFGQGDAT